MPIVHSQLTLTNKIDFGVASGGDTQNLDLYLIPTAPGNCSVTSLTLPTGFTTTTTFPQSISPNAHLVIPIAMAGGTTAGGTATANLTFSDTTTASPTVTLVATAPSSFDVYFENGIGEADSINLGLVDFSNLPSGILSATWIIKNHNSSPHSLLVTSVNVYNSNWTYSGNLSPGAILGTNITKGITFSTQQFQVGAQDGSGTYGDCRLFDITFEDLSSTSNTFILTGYLLYYGTALTSIYTLTGSQYNFLTEWGTTLKRMDASNLNCEEASAFSRQFDFDLPGFQKGIYRVYTRIENSGNVTLTCALTSDNGDNVSKQQVLGVDQPFKVSSNALQGFLWDIISNGEIHNFTLTRAAGSGVLSLTLYGFLFSPRGEVYEGS